MSQAKYKRHQMKTHEEEDAEGEEDARQVKVIAIENEAKLGLRRERRREDAKREERDAIASMIVHGENKKSHCTRDSM